MLRLRGHVTGGVVDDGGRAEVGQPIGVLACGGGGRERRPHRP
jgi:hypothetical protein